MKNNHNNKNLLDILGRALQVEYGMIIHYPRISSMVKDSEMKSLITGLGNASIRHADEVANAISKLGGKPVWSFDALPDENNLSAIFQMQLEKEKLAFQLHRDCMSLAVDIEMMDSFAAIAEEEKSHIQTVEKILTKLSK